MKQMTATQKKWVTVVVVIAALFILNPDASSDKKESAFEWGRTTVGMGAMAAAVIVLIATGGTGFVAAGWLAMGGIAMLSSGLTGLFTPDTGIPMWAYIGGFIVLVIALSKKKK